MKKPYSPITTKVVDQLRQYSQNNESSGAFFSALLQPLWDFLEKNLNKEDEWPLVEAFNELPAGINETKLLDMIQHKVDQSILFRNELTTISSGLYGTSIYVGGGINTNSLDEADAEDDSPGFINWGQPPLDNTSDFDGPSNNFNFDQPLTRDGSADQSSFGMRIYRSNLKKKAAKKVSLPLSPIVGAPRPVSAAPVKKPKPPSTAVTCFFQASMPEQVLQAKPVAVEITISRNEIEAIPGDVNDSGKSIVDSEKLLTVSIHPEINCMIKGDYRKKIAVPSAGESAVVSFVAICTDPGVCKLSVEISQEQVPMVALSLSPVCVEKEKPATKTTTTANAHIPEPFPVHVNQLGIREYQKGNSYYYTYELEAPDLGIFKLFESPPIDIDRQEYVAQLYTEIEELWDNTAGNMEVFNEELRNFGASLFMRLFPEDLRKVLYQNTTNITSIQVISTEPFIPWELLLVKHPDQHTAWQASDKFLGEMGLTRWLHGWTPTQQLNIRKGKAKYIIPQYENEEYQLPAGPKEASYLKKAFTAKEVVPDTLTITKLLRSGDFDLLHFCCHGGADLANITYAKLLLKEVNVNGELKPTYLTQIAVEECGNISKDGNRPLIVVNACETGRLGNGLTGYGGFAKAFLNAGAGAFVGSLWSIEDNAAVSFITTLYDELKTGKTLAEATIAARKRASKEPDSAWISYVVYGHPFAVLKS